MMLQAHSIIEQSMFQLQWESIEEWLADDYSCQEQPITGLCILIMMEALKTFRKLLLVTCSEWKVTILKPGFLTLHFADCLELLAQSVPKKVLLIIIIITQFILDLV